MSKVGSGILASISPCPYFLRCLLLTSSSFLVLAQLAKPILTTTEMAVKRHAELQAWSGQLAHYVACTRVMWMKGTDPHHVWQPSQRPNDGGPVRSRSSGNPCMSHKGEYVAKLKSNREEPAQANFGFSTNACIGSRSLQYRPKRGKRRKSSSR